MSLSDGPDQPRGSRGIQISTMEFSLSPRNLSSQNGQLVVKTDLLIEPDKLLPQLRRPAPIARTRNTCDKQGSFFDHSRMDQDTTPQLAGELLDNLCDGHCYGSITQAPIITGRNTVAVLEGPGKGPDRVEATLKTDGSNAASIFHT